jgi:CRP/FNR family transcriptional regulator
MDWIDGFEGLAGLSEEQKARLQARSRRMSVPAGTVVFGPGRMPEHLLLLLSGTVRVQQTSESGREIVLYRVSGGESCVMTTACLLASQDYTAEGIAETAVEAVAIPRALFEELLAESQAFRRFVFRAYAERMTDLFLVVEDVAFRRMDIRLAQKLLDLADGGDRVAATHQRLASELGTAREVVSRQLGEFQRRGWVTASRGTIRIDDRAGLAELAGTAA